MKQLYIRIGNSADTQRVIIIGEEDSLGSRDGSGYKPSKGQIFESITKVDPYTGSEDLTYIHATPNINLDTALYTRDYDAHEYIKRTCKDIVTWDGEADDGLVRSREAFIVKDGLEPEAVARELYMRLEKEIHHKSITNAIFDEIKKEITTEIKKQYKIKDLEDSLRLLKNLSNILKIYKGR